MLNKKIWVFAAVFLVITTALITLSVYRGDNFKSRHMPFIHEFLNAYGDGWHLIQVQSMVSSSFLLDIDSEQGRAVQNVLRDLGTLTGIINIELEHHQRIKNSQVGIFLVEARFEKSKAILRLVIREKNHISQVDAISVKAVENPPGEGPEHSG